MRIAIWHNLPSGGGLRLLGDHVAGLRARGHEIVQIRPPTAADLREACDLPSHEEPVYRSTDKARRSIRGRLGAARVAARDVQAMDEHAARCGHFIDAGAFDVVYAGSCQFYAAASIGTHVRTPSVQYLGEPRRAHFEAAPDLLWLGRRSEGRRLHRLKIAFVDARLIAAARERARAEVRWARGFDRLLVNSVYSRESVLRAYGIDADVCPPGVDTDRFFPTNAERRPFVLSVGELDHRKNPLLLIEAIAELPAPRPKLVWATNRVRPDCHAAVVELARQLDVEVELRLNPPDAELRDLYGTAGVVVFTPRLEPFGLVALEAAACAAPLVVSAEGGLREIVLHERTGLAVLPRVAPLADAIRRVLDDPAFAASLGRAAWHDVHERWTKSHAVDHLEATLRAVAVGARRG